VRLFYAHPKLDEHDPEAVAAFRAEVAALVTNLRAKLPPEELAHTTLTTGLDDYNARARYCRGFGGWGESVARGVDTQTGRQRFTALIVPHAHTVGRGTFDIVRLALSVRDPAAGEGRVSVCSGGRVWSAAKSCQ
jgi:hypothetical protein